MNMHNVYAFVFCISLGQLPRLRFATALDEAPMDGGWAESSLTG
jgi:hypothetical protein